MSRSRQILLFKIICFSCWCPSSSSLLSSSGSFVKRAIHLTPRKPFKQVGSQASKQTGRQAERQTSKQLLVKKPVLIRQKTPFHQIRRPAKNASQQADHVQPYSTRSGMCNQKLSEGRCQAPGTDTESSIPRVRMRRRCTLVDTLQGVFLINEQ